MSKKFGRTRYIRIDEDVIGYVLVDDGEFTTLYEWYHDWETGGIINMMPSYNWYRKSIMYDLPEILQEARRLVPETKTIHVEIDSAPVLEGAPDKETVAKVFEEIYDGLDPTNPDREELFQRKRKHLINLIREASKD